MRLSQIHSDPLLDFYTADLPTSLELPLFAAGVSAGFPSPAEDYVEIALDLNRELVKHPAATFYARVKGSSMIEAGIEDGDLLVIDTMNSPSEKIAITVNTLLYIIQKSGGVCDFHKVFKILYFADQKHLSRYGSAITDDTYIAMANGPVPSMAYDILKSLRGEGLFSSQKDQFTPYFELQINKHTVKAKKSPDLDYLSESEMRCIDESIEENYHLKFSDLTEKSHDTAWQKAVFNSEIDLLDVATCGGAGNDMIEYIKECRENRLAVFE